MSLVHAPAPESGTGPGCPVCGSPADRRLLPDRWNPGATGIFRCRGCDLAFSAPRQSPEVNLEQYVELADPLYMRPELRARRTYESLLSEIEELKPGRGRLLDVGSAGCQLLATAVERGWDVEGVEISRAFVAYSRERFSFPIHEGELKTAELPAASFDVVVMSHVIEHLTQPAAELAEVWRVLRPGGLLVVECPDFNCPFRILLRSRWWFFVPGHVNHFTHRSLAALLRSLGFEVRKRGHPPSEYSLALLAERFGRLYARRCGSLMQRAVGDGQLGQRTVRLQLFDVLRLFAVKTQAE